MALIIKDRVKEITTTTGTGAVSLGGSSATFDAFQSVMSNGDTTFYAIVHTASGTDEWEVGLGTWNTGNTLTRTTVYAGSNGTSAVNFSSGNKDIFMTYPASKAAVTGEDVTFADVTATNITATGTVTLAGDPSSALQAATKEYVDTIAAAGIHYHTPVRVEAPSALTATYDNGTSGVGATLTNSGTQAALVIDGITLSTSDRVLVYNQTNAAHNGVYTVTNTGSASTNWVLTRATDADSYGASDPDALGEGDAYFVKEGDTGAGELYVMNTSGVITFGTTNITFTVIAETAVYSAGTGLTLTGTEFSTNQDISTSASPTFAGATVNGNITVTGTVDGRDVATDGSKLDNIEANATADQTAAEIKTAYESNSNTNAFTDAEQTKLSGIETGATGDQTASEILTAIKTVDGAASGLDADLLDGQQGSYYLNTGTTFSGDVSGTYNNIVVANDSHTHDGRYYTETEADSRFVNVTGDSMSGALTIATTGTANSPTLAIDTSSSSTFVHSQENFAANLGSGSTNLIVIGKEGSTKNSGYLGYYWDSSASNNNFVSIGHWASDHLFRVYGDGTLKAGASNVIFHDGYHPNADKWTTARTLSLSGDASGSVSWDGSGNATLSVTVADNSHNHDYVPERNRTDWNDSTVISDVIGQLAWKNYGNNHTIFDASAGTSPDGTSVGSTDPSVTWVATYPTLMGWNGTNTYGVRVDSSRYADRWKTARTLSLSGDASGSVSWDGSANATLSVTVANDSHTHDGRYYTESEADSRFTSSDHFKWRGTGYLTSTTTSALKTELLGDDVFDSYVSAFKTGWSYAGNGDLTDAGRLTELAGTSWLTWTDNSSDNVQGNFTALVIAPNTGGSAGKMFVYNDQGSGYAPGWREIWTSSSDGSGSGLDADLLDGVQGSSYLRSDTNDTTSGILTVTDGILTEYIDVANQGNRTIQGLATRNTIGSSGGYGDLHLNHYGGNVYMVGDDFSFTTSGVGTTNGSWRAPIFYDSADTTYYVDPNSTSDAAVRVRGGALFGPNASWGDYLMVGGNGRSNYINNTTTASVATTDGNLHLDSASGHSTYINYYDGEAVYFGSGSNTVVGSISNAGVASFASFTDYNNTGYYVDPAGTSRLHTLRAGDSVDDTPNGTQFTHVLGATGSSNRVVYFDAAGASGGASVWWGNGNSPHGAIDSSTSEISHWFNNTSGTWSKQFGVYEGYVAAINQMRAPIFYDSNDTGYYVDPASSATLLDLRIHKTANGANGSRAITLNDGTVLFRNTADYYHKMWYYDGLAFATNSTHGHFRFYADSNTLRNNNTGGATLVFDIDAQNSITTAYGQMRSPIFYDSNNTGYYINGDSLSNLYQLQVNYNNSTYMAIGASDDVRNGLRMYDTSSVATGIGGQLVLGYQYNTNTYTEGAIIKMYKENGTGGQYGSGLKFQVRNHGEALGTRVWIDPTGNLFSDQSVRAPIFYDYNDTAYYTNPADTSIIKYLGRQNHNTGHFVGGYNNIGSNAAKSNPIYTIGSSYNPADATLSSMYGIGFTYGSSASFISMTGATGWGLYVADNGGARVFLDGSYGRVSGTGATYFPIYYENSNTAYYADIASTSVFNQINVTTLNTTSDIRFKSELLKIDNAVDKVKAISGYTYLLDGSDDRKGGLIAQELEDVLPEAVKGDDHKKLLDYNATIALLVEAIKEQQDQIDDLKKQLNG